MFKMVMIGYDLGLMNPPYSQRVNKATAGLSEIHFIKKLLDSLNKNAKASIIIPQSTMVGKTVDDKKVKKDILKKHTLEGVISLNPETFYGVGTVTCIAVFTAHQPHSENKICKFINFEDDGYITKKHKGLMETHEAIKKRKYLLKCWNNEETNSSSKFIVKSKIKPEDEWLHSFYYYNDEIPTEEEFKKTMADYLSFEFNMVLNNKEYLFE